jgi:hypothetical protein
MKEKKDFIVAGILVVYVFLFFFITGTLTSGFHFVDDHEVIKIKHNFNESSYLNVTKNWVKEDLHNNGRFRPLYYIYRVAETKIFGSDFTLWSIHNGVLLCIGLLLFYFGMRNMKFQIVESLTALIIIFAGPQSSVWWRLGPGESLGMVLLGFSFYLISNTGQKRNYHLNNLFFVFFLILSSLTKESFLIIVPGMIVLKVWNDKINLWGSFKISVNRNLLLLVPLIVIVIELGIIKYYVGTAYADLDSNLINNLKLVFSASWHFFRTYLNLLIAGIIILAISWVIKKSVKRPNLFSIVFFLLILVPNIVLYSRSGLVERYLLPASFGLAFLVVIFLSQIEDNKGWFKKTALILIILSFLPAFAKTFVEARKFSREGEDTKELFSAISLNYIKGTNVMLVADPVESYEYSVSLKTYLIYENQIDLYGYCILPIENHEASQSYIDGWKSYFIGRQFENLTKKPELLIFLDKQKVDEFFNASVLLQKDYQSIDLGNTPYALFKEVIR